MKANYNSETKEMMYTVWKSLFLRNVSLGGNDRALNVEMMHWYYQMYVATNRLELPLSQLRYSEIAGTVGATYSQDMEKAQLALDEYDLAQWKKYLNGEISESDYISYVIEMMASLKNAEERTQEDIDGGKK